MSDIFSIPDEEYLKQPMRTEAPSDEGASSAAQGQEQNNGTVVETPVEQKVDDTPNDQKVEGEQKPTEVEVTPAVAKEGEAAKPDANTPADQKPNVEAKPGDDKAPGSQEKVTQEQAPAVDYEKFAAEIMKPFKANDKMIQVKTPEEAIQLMQMGANYNKKMAELAPHRKSLLMLKNSNLLGNEDQLGFLLDLHNKNPEAIKKLIKDSGIDPLEIDTTTEPAYREGNHRVSDEQVQFNTILDDLKSNPEGLETIRRINTDWDQASKEELLTNPNAMTIIHRHRELGVYDQIVAEMDRRKTFGKISPEAKFLAVYQAVGKEMTEANAFATPAQPSEEQKPAATPVATRTLAPKPAVVNDKAKAAAATRTTPSVAKPVENPFAVSDEEYLRSRGR